MGAVPNVRKEIHTGMTLETGATTGDKVSQRKFQQTRTNRQLVVFAKPLQRKCGFSEGVFSLIWKVNPIFQVPLLLRTGLPFCVVTVHTALETMFKRRRHTVDSVKLSARNTFHSRISTPRT